MAQKFEENLKVINGPSKWDLILALFEGKKVDFAIRKDHMVRVQVNSIEAEDASRESWNITGRVVGISYSPQEPNHIIEGLWKDTRIYFNTKRRIGTLAY